MSLILQIETATTACSVSLANNGEVLAIKELNVRNIHAEVITLFIQDVMAGAGRKLNELDAVAVSCGPGSYTGLRIGVSTAKGLCFALDKPLIAINTLQAMAKGYINGHKDKIAPGTLFCPMIDARRMEVFTAIFEVEGNEVRPTSAEIIDADSFADLLANHQIIFFGDGAGKCREVLAHNSNAIVVDDVINSSAHLSNLALGKLNNKEFEDVAYFEPYYLKDFIAGKKAS